MDNSCYFLKYDPDKDRTNENLNEYNCRCDFMINIGSEYDAEFYKNKCGRGKCKYYIEYDYNTVKNILINYILQNNK